MANTNPVNLNQMDIAIAMSLLQAQLQSMTGGMTQGQGQTTASAGTAGIQAGGMQAGGMQTGAGAMGMQTGASQNATGGVTVPRIM